MKKYIILISVYNDWKSVFKLLENIDAQIAGWNADVSILIINDASTEDRPKVELSFKNIKSFRIMNMKKNKGHARCNAAGLKFLIKKEDFDYVILMDGDGEDRPEELALLFNKCKENHFVYSCLLTPQGKFFADFFILTFTKVVINRIIKI